MPANKRERTRKKERLIVSFRAVSRLSRAIILLKIGAQIGFRSLLIQTFFAFRSGVPAFMNPEPLFGIFADVFFDDVSDLLRQIADVFFGMVAFGVIHGRFEIDDVFLFRFFPDSESGHHNGVCF